MTYTLVDTGSTLNPGEISTDSFSNPWSTTLIWLSPTMSNGDDVTRRFSDTAGQLLMITQADDPTKWMSFVAHVQPQDIGGVFETPVEAWNGGGALDLGPVQVEFLPGEVKAPEAPEAAPFFKPLLKVGYHVFSGMRGSSSTQSFGMNSSETDWFPIHIPVAATFDQLTVIANSGGGQGRFGLYASDADGFPTGDVIPLGSAFSISGTGSPTSSPAFSVALEPGWYWVGYQVSASITFDGVPADAAHMLFWWTNRSPFYAMYSNNTYASGLPSPAPGTLNPASWAPKFWLRRSA